jgi:hypothetical protein
MTHATHVNLLMENANGSTEPVEVQRLGDGGWLILHSPGFVEGIAAGDCIRVLDERAGTFEVLRRGGNVSVKWACGGSPETHRVIDEITRGLEPLGGRLDGTIGIAAVWTVPVASGFPRIEAVMAAAKARLAGSEWWYGNVYDVEGKPLDWW